MPTSNLSERSEGGRVWLCPTRPVDNTPNLSAAHTLHPFGESGNSIKDVKARHHFTAVRFKHTRAEPKWYVFSTLFTDLLMQKPQQGPVPQPQDIFAMRAMILMSTYFCFLYKEKQKVNFKVLAKDEFLKILLSSSHSPS